MKSSVHVKAVCLVVLTFVTTVTVVLLRYSRNVPVETRYISSTAIVVAEIIKVVACVISVFVTSGFDVVRTINVLKNDVIFKWTETSKLLFPSFLYVIQNNLLYSALSHLTAATYQITYQLKILTTAIFSYYLLKKKLAGVQWFSLVVLFVGVVLVQIDPDSVTSEMAKNEGSTVIGLLCVLAASLSSGLAGVTFEKLVKSGTQTSLTIRNIQMGALSVIFGLVAAYQDRVEIMEKGPLAGYNLLTWIVIMLQAFGGLLVAVTIKYADNILKGFAASFSIIFSSIGSFFILGELKLTASFVAGTVLVVVATFLYAAGAGAVTAATPAKTSEAKKICDICGPYWSCSARMCNLPTPSRGKGASDSDQV